MSVQPAWDFSDAWIFAAIGTHRHGSDLKGIISSADYYNHAIPEIAELRQAVGRLTASGLVTSDQTRVVVTPAGRAVWQRSEGSGYEFVKSLHKALADVPLSEGSWPVTSEQVGEAYRQYSAGVDKFLRVLTWFLPWTWGRRRDPDLGG